MSKFCTRCGKELHDGEKCTCRTEKTAAMLKKLKIPEIMDKLYSLLVKIGLTRSKDEKNTLFETGFTIVPDIVKATDGEIAVKQYEIATLRSRSKGAYAKGRLQVTNKRVIFRGAGFSYKGRLALQHEFAIDEITGIETKRTNRFSWLNALGALYATFVVAGVFSRMFQWISKESVTLGIILSFLFAVASTVPFFILNKKCWLKFLSVSCGLGALFGTSALASSGTADLMLGVQTNIVDYVLLVFLVLWLINFVFVCLVPDLTLIIKTKAAAEAITVRRKQYSTLFMQEIEYSGFSEVIPSENIDLFIREIGALINDIQTFGDNAIEQWKEKA